MKRIFTTVALIATTISFGQVNQQEALQRNTDKVEPGNVISANLVFSSPAQIGITYEKEGKLTFYRDSEKASSLINVSYGSMNYEVANLDLDGSGYVIEIGNRYYYGEEGREFKGFYSGNYLSYGSIEFDDTVLFAKVEGTYSYFSFFSPEIGYKIKFGNFIVDPFVGAQWKIEIKGKGDIDNNNTDEWAFRAGVKLGYRF